MSDLEAFLAGDRPDDVAIYVAGSAVGAGSDLRELADPVGEGFVLVVDGDRGRQAFAAATGVGGMEFAGAAMDREGHIAPTLGAGECPDAPEAADGGGRGGTDDGGDRREGTGDGNDGQEGSGDDPEGGEGHGPGEDRDDAGAAHRVEFALAFAEERNEAAGGVYAEGDVVHAYAKCACGTAYSDRWLAGERSL